MREKSAPSWSAPSWFHARSCCTSIDLSISPTIIRAISDRTGSPRGAKALPTRSTSARALYGTRSLGAKMLLAPSSSQCASSSWMSSASASSVDSPGASANVALQTTVRTRALPCQKIELARSGEAGIASMRSTLSGTRVNDHAGAPGTRAGKLKARSIARKSGDPPRWTPLIRAMDGATRRAGASFPGRRRGARRGSPRTGPAAGAPRR